MLISVAVNPLAAQEVTIAEAVVLGLSHNPTIVAADAQISAAESSTQIAKGNRLPSLNISTGVQRSDAPLDAFGSLLQQRRLTAADFSPSRINNPGYITNYHSQALLSMPLYHGGALGAAIDAGDAQTLAKRAEHKAVEQRIVAQIISVFINAKANSAEIIARQQEVVAARQQLRDIQQLQQQGMALESDAMDAKAHLLQSRLARIHSQNGYATSIDRLRQLTTDQNLTIVGDITLRPVTGSVESWVKQAVQQRADLQALLATREAMAHQRDIQQASWLPNVDLVASQQWNSGTVGLRNRNSTIGAIVSINLFNGGRDQANIARVEANLLALDANITQKEGSIRQQIQQQWRQWQEAQLQLDNAQQLFEQRREALRIRKLRHQQGLETSSELLRTQVAHDVAQVSIIRARYDLLQTTTLLYLSAGALTQEIIQ